MVHPLCQEDRGNSSLKLDLWSFLDRFFVTYAISCSFHVLVLESGRGDLCGAGVCEFQGKGAFRAAGRKGGRGRITWARTDPRAAPEGIRGNMMEACIVSSNMVYRDSCMTCSMRLVPGGAGKAVILTM